jgi:hypothetical protein
MMELGNIKGEEIPMDYTPAGVGHKAYTILEPIGVVVAVSAFNHPLNLAIHQVIPAIASGLFSKATCTQPTGNPAFWINTAKRNVHSGVKLAGLVITGPPLAMGGVKFSFFKIYRGVNGLMLFTAQARQKAGRLQEIQRFEILRK